MNGNEGSRIEILRALDLSEFRERVFWKCSATLDSSTLIQRSRDLDTESKEKPERVQCWERVDNDISTDLRWSKVWLFGSRDRRIDFILSADCAAFELVGLLISSPLGSNHWKTT